MKKLFNALTSFRFELQMEAEPKPKREHYLIERLNRLRKSHTLARKDQNLLKIRQAEFLIRKVEAILEVNKGLLYAHIEQKQGKNTLN
jgi:hypothetical protein